MEKQPKVIEINGALIALYPIEGLKAVSVNVEIKAGSWYEGNNVWGKAHLLEHMLFQGTEKFKDSEAMGIFQEEFGIWSNAATGGSGVEVSLRMPGESFKQGLDILSEMLFKVSIPDEALLKEKKIIKQEYDDRLSRPGARFWEKGVRQMFGDGHLYTRNGIGTKECFEAATREDLLVYMKEKIVPANMCMGIAGNFRVDEAGKYLREILVRRGERVKVDFGVIKPSYERVTDFEAGMTTATVQITWLGRGMEDTTLEERVRIRLGSYLLGGSARSMLFKAIREQLGLAYGISTSTEYYPTVGWLGVDTSVKTENVERVIEEVEVLIKRFVGEPIDELILERAKKYLMMQKQMAYESTMGTASSLSSSLFWSGRLVSTEEYQEILGKITEREVREVISGIVLSKEPLVAVMRSE